jgi:hypothetical protein
MTRGAVYSMHGGCERDGRVMHQQHRQRADSVRRWLLCQWKYMPRYVVLADVKSRLLL